MDHDILDFDLLHFLHLTPFDDFYETFLWSSNLPIRGLICTLQVVSISRFLRSLSSVTLCHFISLSIMHLHSYHHHSTIHFHILYFFLSFPVVIMPGSHHMLSVVFARLNTPCLIVIHDQHFSPNPLRTFFTKSLAYL